MRKKRFLSMLVLLMTVVTGAWAQTYTVTFSGADSGSLNKAFNNVTMPYSFGAVNGLNLTPWTVIAGEASSYTNVYVSSGGEGKVSVSYTWNNMTITISGAFEGTATIHCDGEGDEEGISRDVYVTCVENRKVSVKEGTEDATNWSITPAEATTTGVAAGAEVKATYSGTKLVKSVKAVKKPEPKLDLATVTEATTVEDGYTVFGTLGANVKISIADGATVTLDGVTISNGQIACSGNATIILMGTNSVTGANAAIKIGGSGTTLTITGSGSLTAQGGWGSAGIGTDSNGSGGNIVINGGTVTATGGMYGAGIGTGNAQGSSNTCGDITINGGRVTAQGGSNAAGIGTGISSMSMSSTSDSNNTCGAITIGTGVTMVTATKGSSAPNSIGKGKGGMGANQACGTITIGGDATTYAAGVTASPFTYPTAP